MDLIEYLSQLDAYDDSWGIWVNPKDPLNEYQISRQLESDDGWKFIGNLERLSFLGNVSVDDILLDIAREDDTPVDEFKKKIFKRMYFDEGFSESDKEDLENEIYLRVILKAKENAEKFVQELLE